MKKKVMVAIDESECSHYALEWALDNLKDMIAGSELVVFCVQSLTNMGYVYASSLVSLAVPLSEFPFQFKSRPRGVRVSEA
ncbi:hypothetical protein SAY86_025834 [Trapa natans]|uniref:UspA domain-containing protein n=1 Tax=Trapa natans TaxID=22666 RepID=A0AAN7KGV9_TRANT|nr:hypothetical protein SAY86_025834 [Trapa natans]